MPTAASYAMGGVPYENFSWGQLKAIAKINRILLVVYILLDIKQRLYTANR